MDTRPQDAVERWFGAGFDTLHPLLRALHRRGGELHGTVHVRYGRGLAGWLGHRIARKLGLPADAGSTSLRVRIHSDRHVLHWQRMFGGRLRMDSRFVPVGHWPDGYWLEQTGALQLRLAVDTHDGGWSWRPLGYRLSGIPIPGFLMPRVVAGKTIENDLYRFEVVVTLPWLGILVAYGGLLAHQFAEPEPGGD